MIVDKVWKLTNTWVGLDPRSYTGPHTYRDNPISRIMCDPGLLSPLSRVTL
jgi:hypothetical protein